MIFASVIIVATFSFSALASDLDPNYQENCSKRYIRASQDLVVIAEAYNDGNIGKAEYAARVAAVDSTVLALRAYCLNEAKDAQLCVSQSKPGYTKIRNKMYVRDVLQNRISSVNVSRLDLLKLVKASVGGFFRGLRIGNKNACSLDPSFGG
jgi:hypothetical protein